MVTLLLFWSFMDCHVFNLLLNAAGNPPTVEAQRSASSVQLKRSGIPSFCRLAFVVNAVRRGGFFQRPMSQQLPARTRLTTAPLRPPMDGQTCL